MKRWLVWLVALVILGGLVLIPAVTYGHGSGGSDSDVARINDYRAEFVVDEDGGLDVTETLKVYFPIYKHGIFRFFDLADPDDDRVRLVPRDVEVTRDGNPEPFEVLHEGHGRYRNVKIGSANVTMDGEHTYVIRYHVNDVLSKKGDGSQFYWNLIPSGWQMQIEQSTLVVRLPANGEQVRCAVGVGATTGCTVTGVGTRTLTTRTGALSPHTPVTLQTRMDIPAPAREHRPWPVRFDAVLGPSMPILIAVGVLAIFTAALGLILARGSRESEPPYPVMYAPPDGVGPAEALYVYSEQVPREAFVASIMQTAEKGATSLEHDDGWTIRDTGSPDAWRALDPVSAYAAESLGVTGGSFTADKTVTSGKKLKSALSQFEAATKSWARENGLVVSAGVGGLGSLLVLGAMVLAGFLAVKNPFDLSVIALVPGLFAIFALETLRPGSSTRRTTPAGRELWSRIGGFRRILATDSAEARFDFSGRKELYTAYIPWAVAFGVADKWAEKYRIATGEEPPEPSYASSWGSGYVGGSFASSMADDFSHTVNSAISAYQATQSSSSSGGGGGFSGGGGGGGGGGGSW